MSAAIVTAALVAVATGCVGVAWRPLATVPRRPPGARATVGGAGTRRRGRGRTRPPGEVEVARWCELVAGGVRAGHSLTRAVVDADQATPVEQRPFADVAHAVARGRPLADPLRAVDDDPSSPRGLLAPILVAAIELGGGAAAPIDRVARTLDARADERRERQAASAQARLSARVLTVLPGAVLGVLALADGTIRQTLGTPAGLTCALAGGALNLLGWWWMRRIIGVGP